MGVNRIAKIRTTGDDYEPRRFRTWGAKAIALIGKLPATLESRAIHLELCRIGPGETITPIRSDRLQHFEPLARQAARWAEDHVDELKLSDPDMPAVVTGLRADNWRHLIAIADVVGGIWSGRARKAAETLSAGRLEETAGIMLLSDVRDIFTERGINRISSADLAVALTQIETRPWPEWSKGKPITPRQIANLLAPFRIAPATIRTETATLKGYHQDQFIDAFERYLPIYPSHRHNPQNFDENGHPLSVTREHEVTDGKTCQRRSKLGPRRRSKKGPLVDAGYGVAGCPGSPLEGPALLRVAL